jgi:tetratricopeptide (TPR) repeat protein
MTTTTVAAVVWVLGAAAALPAHPPSVPGSRELTRTGYRQAYELRFDESLQTLANARRTDPLDPAPPRAIAAVTWMEILFAQGVATYAAFQGSPSADTVARPAVPPVLAARFSEHAELALKLAQQRAADFPDDPDAQYQLGAAWGLLALYRGTVEGRAMAAFMDGRRAVAIMTRLRKSYPDAAEAALIPGIYRYAVSTLPWHKRLVATAAGLPGDKAAGIRLLEAAAAPTADTSTDASLVLMTIYSREGQPREAMRILERLVSKYPGNRLLRLNLAMTAFDSGNYAAAAANTNALTAESDLAAPSVKGEWALWSYVRGAARIAQNDAGGVADLERATREDSRDWIRARAHLELAKFAFRSGDSGRGRVELDTALRFARRADDEAALRGGENLAKTKGQGRS